MAAGHTWPMRRDHTTTTTKKQQKKKQNKRAIYFTTLIFAWVRDATGLYGNGVPVVTVVSLSTTNNKAWLRVKFAIKNFP